MQSGEKGKSPFQTKISQEIILFSFSLHHAPSPSSQVHTQKLLYPSLACSALPPTSASHGGEKATPHNGQLYTYFFTLNPTFYSIGGFFLLFCFLYSRISVPFDSSLLHRCTAERAVLFPGSFKPCLPCLGRDKVFSLLPFIPESLTNIH